MKYALLCYETADNFAARTDAKRKDAFWADLGHYMKALTDAGVMAGGAGLQPPETATTLRYRGEERLVQDGPYPETKEQLGGFFIVEVSDLDAAMEWAARFPRLPGRVIEVRPVLPPLE
ncbi:MAG: YciI family protein [Pseudomonadota bacterium]